MLGLWSPFVVLTADDELTLGQGNGGLRVLLIFRNFIVVGARAAVPIPRCTLVPIPYAGQWHGTCKG